MSPDATQSPAFVGPPAADSAARPIPLDLTSLFAPGAIAVVGASPDLDKPGGRCLSYLCDGGYAGRVYPVNPRYSEIQGLPAYSSLGALPEPVDLAVLIIPAPAVLDAVATAGARGIRGLVVCSSGFSEAGAEGKLLETALQRAATEAGVALLGPNCLGYFDARTGVAATFSTALQLDSVVSGGNVAFVSQSGALGAAVFSLGRRQHAGLGMFVSTGNEACLGVADVLRHLASDCDITTVLSYIEGVRDGRALVDAARVARVGGKRLVVIKVGRTHAGVRASQSHTGAMAGSNVVWDAALRRSGAIVATDMQGLLGAGIALDVCGDRDVGKRIGLVSMSGGAGALMADRAAEHGLELPILGDIARARLAEVLPAFSGTANPVDYGAVYGDPEAIEATVRAVAQADEVDLVGVFVGLTPGHVGALEPRLARVATEVGKPLLVAWLGAPIESLGQLRACGVPAFDDATAMIDAASALVAAARPLQEHLPTPPGGAIRSQLTVLGAEGRQISEAAMKRLLAEVGMPVVTDHLAASADEAHAIAHGLGSAVAVKVDADALLHKSDIGGVELNIKAEDVPAAFERVTAAAVRAGYAARGALISAMAPRGVELIVGARWDPQFGATVMVGAGGVMAELLDDVCVELAPVSVDQARRMLARLAMGPLLTGFRGAVACDVGAVANVIADASRVAAEAGDALTELDLNPVVVYPEGAGCLILDAAAIVGDR